jgi:hypothetical protein
VVGMRDVVKGHGEIISHELLDVGLKRPSVITQFNVTTRIDPLSVGSWHKKSSAAQTDPRNQVKPLTGPGPTALLFDCDKRVD